MRLTLLVLLLPVILYGYEYETVLIIQLVVFLFTSILDKVDGEIARVKKYFTQSGVYYDILFHFNK